jgi:hypothetical protein
MLMTQESKAHRKLHCQISPDERISNDEVPLLMVAESMRTGSESHSRKLGDINTVAVALGGRNDKENQIRRRLVMELVRHHRRNLDTLVFAEYESFVLNLHGRNPLEHEKELPRFLVIVFPFRLSGRDTLLNYTKVFSLDEVPAIASITPEIMFRPLDIDWACHSTIFTPPA